MKNYVSSSNLSGVPCSTDGFAFSSGKRCIVMSLREALALRGFTFEALQKDSSLNTLSADNTAVAFLSTQTVSADKNGRLLQLHKDGAVLFSFPLVKPCEGGGSGEFYFVAESFRVVILEKNTLRLVHSA